MTATTDHWQTGIDWDARVRKVVSYYDSRPLTYGPEGQDKACPMIDDLCEQGAVGRDALNSVTD